MPTPLFMTLGNRLTFAIGEIFRICYITAPWLVFPTGLKQGSEQYAPHTNTSTLGEELMTVISYRRCLLLKQKL